MRNYALLFGLAALGLVYGCQQAPAPPRAEKPNIAPAAMVRGEADQLMERGEYAKAAAKYQEAVALEPEDMSLRFALGTAYSHLGRRAEAAEQFQWVVKGDDPASEQYKSARQWLVSAGLLTDGRVAARTEESAPAAPASSPTKGKLGGSLEWPGVNSRERLIKVRVTLTGDDPGTKSVNLSRPFRLGERYEFRDLEPGKYNLVAKVEDGAPAVELWNQSATVEAGQMTQLALGAGNSKVSPDQFPGPPPQR
ncbi:MAG TPA: tetratricopeptide repeat protein [Candidatus Bathyarchaeia archaeon]|nr:tetratricopeptide repeat protein [Candidatus Bathyarchaeia archaeon]